MHDKCVRKNIVFTLIYYTEIYNLFRKTRIKSEVRFGFFFCNFLPK